MCPERRKSLLSKPWITVAEDTAEVLQGYQYSSKLIIVEATDTNYFISIDDFSSTAYSCSFTNLAAVFVMIFTVNSTTKAIDTSC